MSEEEDKDKCPPNNVVVVDKDSICGTEERDDLTDQISRQGFSALFFREIDRGNQIADITNPKKTMHYLTAMKEAAIQCDDLWQEFFEIQGDRSHYDSMMEMYDPILQEYRTRTRQYMESDGGYALIPSLDMAEMVEWKADINQKNVKLHLRTLDTLSQSLIKVYGEDAKDLLKMLVEGEI